MKCDAWGCSLLFCFHHSATDSEQINLSGEEPTTLSEGTPPRIECLSQAPHYESREEPHVASAVLIGAERAVRTRVNFSFSTQSKTLQSCDLLTEQARKRLEKEMTELTNFLHEYNIHVVDPSLVDDNICHWEFAFKGPTETPYEQGQFTIDVQFPASYPYNPPQVCFTVPIWHPNVSRMTGAICLDVLGHDWCPALTADKVLLSIISLLSNPEPQDPVEPKAARMFMNDHALFVRSAECFTELFASSSCLCEAAQIEKLLRVGFSYREANQILRCETDLEEGKVGILSKYFLLQANGAKPPLPDGYRPEVLNGLFVLRHTVTNIVVKAQPLRPSAAQDDLTVVYHYAPPAAFFPICQSGEVWATLLQTAKNDKDTCHGDGVYTTAKSPSDFDTKQTILINNYSNAEDHLKQQQHIQKHLDCADYCIPIVVPRASVYDVMKVATPENCYVPGFSRHGQPLRSDRDIKVIVLQDADGAVQNAKENLNTLLPLLDHLNKDVRKHAIIALMNVPGHHTPAAVEAVLSRLDCEKIATVYDHVLCAVEILIPEREPPLEVLDPLGDSEHSEVRWQAFLKRKRQIILTRSNGPDPDLRILARRIYGLTLEHAAVDLRGDRELVMIAVKNNGLALEHAAVELQSDRELVMTAVKSNGLALRHAAVELQSDREFVITAVKNNGLALQYAAMNLRGDVKIIMTAVENNVRALQYVVTKKLQSDRLLIMAALENSGRALEYPVFSARDFVMTEVAKTGHVLEYVTEELRGDREIVMAAVKKRGLALEYAAVELKSDRELVMIAVKNNGLALEHAAVELQSDREIIMTAVMDNWLALEHAAVELQSDRELVMTAVKSKGLALRHDAVELQSDREILMAAVKTNELALKNIEEGWYIGFSKREPVITAVKLNVLVLRHAAMDRQSDRELVMTAVENNFLALRHAPVELQSDRELVLAVVKNNGLALKHAAVELQSDREIIMAAVRTNELALKHIAVELRSDRALRMAYLRTNQLALKNSVLALEHVAMELQSDCEIIMAAVKTNELALEHAAVELQSDRELVMAAVKNNGLAPRHAAMELQSDRELAMTAVKNNGLAPRHAAMELQSDRELVMAAVRTNELALEHAAVELRSDRELVMAAVKNNVLALEHAAVELQSDPEIIMIAVKFNELALKHIAVELRSDRELVMAAVKNSVLALEHAAVELQSDCEIFMTVRK